MSHAVHEPGTALFGMCRIPRLWTMKPDFALLGMMLKWSYIIVSIVLQGMQFLLEPQALPSLLMESSCIIPQLLSFFMGQQGLLPRLHHHVQVPFMLRPKERKASQIIPVAATMKATFSQFCCDCRTARQHSTGRNAAPLKSFSAAS